MLASELEKASAVAISAPNTLVISFPPRYNQAREFCQEPGRLARIEQVVQRVSGQPWQVRVETVGGPTVDSSNAADDSASQPSRYRRQRAEAVQEPLLKRAIDVLGAQLVHLDEDFGAAPAAADDGGQE